MGKESSPETLAFIKRMEDSVTGLNESLMRKIETPGNKEELSEQELKSYAMNDEDKVIFDAFSKYTEGEVVPGFNFNDFLGTPQAKILMPQVIIGKMREAAKIENFVSALYKEVAVKTSNVMVFPSIGSIRAHDVGEGQEYPEEGLGIQSHQTDTVSILKTGLRLAFTEELLQDAEWSIVSILTEEAGKAMARHKEEKVFKEFMRHGHVVFDNAIRADHPEAGTTGVDFNNQLNNTLSTDDLLDLIIMVMNNEHIPTDIIMHPLVWPILAQNGLVGAYGLPMESPNGSFKLGPATMQGRLPFSFNVGLSPFAPIDREAKTYGFFCIDRNNIGEILMREKMTMDSFVDPRVDIKNIKFRERYGLRTNDQGRGICLAKNIALTRSWPIAERTTEVDKPSHL